MDVIVTAPGRTGARGKYIVEVVIEDEQRAIAAELVVTTRAEADAWDALAIAQGAAAAPTP